MSAAEDNSSAASGGARRRTRRRGHAGFRARLRRRSATRGGIRPAEDAGRGPAPRRADRARARALARPHGGARGARCWGARPGAARATRFFSPRLRALAASLLLGAIGYGGGLLPTGNAPPQAPPRDERALASAFMRAQISGQSVDIASSDRHVVKPWLAGRAPLATAARRPRRRGLSAGRRTGRGRRRAKSSRPWSTGGANIASTSPNCPGRPRRSDSADEERIRGLSPGALERFRPRLCRRHRPARGGTGRFRHPVPRRRSSRAEENRPK